MVTGNCGGSAENLNTYFNTLPTLIDPNPIVGLNTMIFYAQYGLTLNDINLIELNEAFASQALAVTRELGINPDIINVNGGAIALGHPLGCTGAKLSVQLFDEMKRRGNKYGIVSMCVGTGQGAAGIYEIL